MVALTPVLLSAAILQADGGPQLSRRHVDLSCCPRGVCGAAGGASGGRERLPRRDASLGAGRRRSGLLPLVQERSADVPAGDELAVDAMDAAAELGRLEVVKWLHEHRGEGCTTDAMDLAAANGHLDMVKWLHDHRSEGCTELAMDLAAVNGHLQAVKWLHMHRAEGCSDRALVDASANGHARVARWLLQFRQEGGAVEAAMAAAANGHVELALWLSKHEFLRDERSIEQVDERWRQASMFVDA